MKGIPRLYAILDGDKVRAAGLPMIEVAEAFRAAGVRLVQYRDKRTLAGEMLEQARAIKRVFQDSDTILLLNDFTDLVEPAGWDGVHLGQADMGIREARQLLGASKLIGVSTHTVEQLREAARTSADYIAYGPVFPTSNKRDAETVVGLEGLRAARALTSRPLVAIGGISQARISEVLTNGADSVAAIGAFFEGGRSVLENAVALVREVG